MPRNQKYTSKPLIFGSFSRLIDALMLFGASIEALPNRNYRLLLRRPKDKGAPLIWAVIVTESQDPLFDFLLFTASQDREGRRCFRTRTTRFLEDSYQRWYVKGEVRMPDDVAVDDRAVLFWLLGSWAIGKPITLPLLGASEDLTARLAEEVKRVSGWCVGTSKGHLTLAGRPWIENWLRKKGVPERVWK